MTRAGLFEAMGEALTAIVTDPSGVRAADVVEIRCSAPDNSVLLVDWLNALVYEMATRRMLFRRFDVQLDGSQLHASACGESIDVARHQPATEIKGATYTQLAVREDRPGEWRAQCVVDV